jgi:hypothetical protein
MRKPKRKMLLNARLEGYARAQFARLAACNPWHVAFAVGLSWGHLAQETGEFTDLAVSLMSDFDAATLEKAGRPDPKHSSNLCTLDT